MVTAEGVTPSPHSMIVTVISRAEPAKIWLRSVSERPGDISLCGDGMSRCQQNQTQRLSTETGQTET